MTTNQLAALLAEAKTSAVMIVENIYGQDGAEYLAARFAIAAAENYPSAINSLNAEDACLAYLVSSPSIALSEINSRIARRAGSVTLSESAQRTLRGED
jgi:hypothetical protein